jgi:transketolase
MPKAETVESIIFEILEEAVQTSPESEEYAKLREIAEELREDVIHMLLEAGSGHTAGSLGTADILATLYFHVLNVNPKKPNDPNRDRFILSNGHICPILYATLAKKGYFPRKKLWTLRKTGSPLQGHPKIGTLPGIENTSGSLGQGLSQAVGMALAAKHDNKKHKIYCMTGDGELNEGQIWEAALFAGTKPLNNLVWIIDRNGIQIDGRTEDVMPLENLRNKLEGFNWLTLEIDGHNIEEIINSCSITYAVVQRPTAIIAHTVPGRGVDFMEYKVEWHGKVPSKTEAQKAIKRLRSLKGKIDHD